MKPVISLNNLARKIMRLILSNVFGISFVTKGIEFILKKEKKSNLHYFTFFRFLDLDRGISSSGIKIILFTLACLIINPALQLCSF